MRAPDGLICGGERGRSARAAAKHAAGGAPRTMVPRRRDGSSGAEPNGVAGGQTRRRGPMNQVSGDALASGRGGSSVRKSTLREEVRAPSAAPTAA